MNSHRQSIPIPEMVKIPAGAFTMGTSADQIERLAASLELAKKWQQKGFFNREQPEHSVYVPAFSIGKYPLTVGEYRAFLTAGGYNQSIYWTHAGWMWRYESRITFPKHWDEAPWCTDERLPVVGVSWYEAYAYCQWLSAVTGRLFRLSSEIEWEKAARGTDGRAFPWGEFFDGTRCNTRQSGLGHTMVVGCYSPSGDSPYGCTDMVGNVSEWTASRFMPYPYNPEDGREAPESPQERTTRGGSWHSIVLRARTTTRGMNDPFFRDDDLGFRCALDGDG